MTGGHAILVALIIPSLLIFFRVGAFIAFLPPLNGQGIPATVKIGLAAAITFLLAGRYAPMMALTLNMSSEGVGAWLQLAFLGIWETALGVGLAWLFSLCLVPVRIAGAWIAQEMGLTLGGLSSPMDQQPSNVISTMLEAVSIIVFLCWTCITSCCIRWVSRLRSGLPQVPGRCLRGILWFGV